MAEEALRRGGGVALEEPAAAKWAWRLSSRQYCKRETLGRLERLKEPPCAPQCVSWNAPYAGTLSLERRRAFQTRPGTAQ